MVNGNTKTTNETNTSKNTYKTDIFFELDNEIQRKIVEFASSEKNDFYSRETYENFSNNLKNYFKL